MKVQISIEISDDERIGIGVVVNSTFRPASREDVRLWGEAILERALEPVGNAVDHNREALVEALSSPGQLVIGKDGTEISV